MPDITINFLAVLVAAILSMAIGSLWYSPLFFGPTWVRLLKKSPKEMESMKKGMGGAYSLTFIAAFLMSYVLAQIINITRSFTVLRGMQAGFWLWVGFVLTTSLGAVLFEKRPVGLYWINNLYYLVSLLLTGVVLALWR